MVLMYPKFNYLGYIYQSKVKPSRTLKFMFNTLTTTREVRPGTTTSETKTCMKC